MSSSSGVPPLTSSPATAALSALKCRPENPHQKSRGWWQMLHSVPPPVRFQATVLPPRSRLLHVRAHFSLRGLRLMLHPALASAAALLLHPTTLPVLAYCLSPVRPQLAALLQRSTQRHVILPPQWLERLAAPGLTIS